MMDLSTIIALFSLAVAGLSLLYQRRQTLVAEQVNRTDTRNVTKQSWWKAPPTLALILITVASWVPTIYSVIPRPIPTVTAWGGGPGLTSSGSTPNLQVTLEGKSLRHFAERFNIMAIAFHFHGENDPDRITSLQRSAIYNIRDPIEMLLIKTDIGYTQEILRGEQMTNYKLLMIPKGVQTNQFQTIEQAQTIGAQVIWSGEGPP